MNAEVASLAADGKLLLDGLATLKSRMAASYDSVDHWEGDVAAVSALLEQVPESLDVDVVGGNNSDPLLAVLCSEVKCLSTLLNDVRRDCVELLQALKGLKTLTPGTRFCLHYLNACEFMTSNHSLTLF